LTFRCIAYNMHRMTNLLVIVMVSTKPIIGNNINIRSKLAMLSAFATVGLTFAIGLMLGGSSPSFAL
jgi:hypothetical protein